MDYYEKKAQDFVRSFDPTEELPALFRKEAFSDVLEANLVAGIAQLLKEQDRDTRHACASSVSASWIQTVDQAHDVCINTDVTKVT